MGLIIFQFLEGCRSDSFVLAPSLEELLGLLHFRKTAYFKHFLLILSLRNVYKGLPLNFFSGGFDLIVIKSNIFYSTIQVLLRFSIILDRIRNIFRNVSR